MNVECHPLLVALADVLDRILQGGDGSYTSSGCGSKSSALANVTSASASPAAAAATAAACAPAGDGLELDLNAQPQDGVSDDEGDDMPSAREDVLLDTEVGDEVSERLAGVSLHTFRSPFWMH